MYLPNMKILIDLHNEARNNGSWMWKISPLVIDDRLMFYAQDWADWMADNNRMVHSSMGDILKLGFNRAGENIAWGQKDEKSVMSSWLWSPGHRANIMSSSYSKIGCAASYSKYDRLYWCVCFGRD
jgi:uncharacterized protein YkwD